MYPYTPQVNALQNYYRSATAQNPGGTEGLTNLPPTSGAGTMTTNGTLPTPYHGYGNFVPPQAPAYPGVPPQVLALARQYQANQGLQNNIAQGIQAVNNGGMMVPQNYGSPNLAPMKYNPNAGPVPQQAMPSAPMGPTNAAPASIAATSQPAMPMATPQPQFRPLGGIGDSMPGGVAGLARYYAR